MALKNFVKKYYIYILIFCLGLGLRVYALSMYPPLHIDEPCSFAASTTSNELDKDIPLKEKWNYYRFIFGKTYYSKDVQKAFFVGDNSFSGLIKDLSFLRNNNIDRQHPTLYYTIMRIWNLSLGEFQPHRYIEHARNFNLILYVVSFFFMFKLLKLLKDDLRFVSLGLFFAFVASGGIMLDTMAREYSLMTMFFIIVTYLSFIVYRKILNNIKIGVSDLIWYPVASSLFLLSGYYAVIYMAMVFGVLLILSLYYRRWETFVRLIIISQLILLYTIAFYPDYFNFSYNNEHYETVKDNMFLMFSPQRIMEKFPTLIGHLKRYVFEVATSSVVLFFVSLSFFISGFGVSQERKFSKKETAEIFALIFCALCWGAAVNHTVVYLYYARYILPAIAIYCLLTTMFVYRFNTIVMSIVVALSLFFCFNQIKNRTIFDVDRIEYTNAEGEHIYTYTKIPRDRPIVVVNPSYYPFEHFMFACVPTDINIPILFENEMPDQNFIYKKYTLVCPKDWVFDQKPFINIRGGRSVYLIDRTREEFN